MKKYAVVLLGGEKEAGKVASILKLVDDAAYENYTQRGVYFVRYSGTAQQLAERIGFSDDRGAQSGIVVGIGGQYYGYANRDLWTWMRDS